MSGESAVAGRFPGARLVGALGGRYSTALGIDLAAMEADEIFNWFVACVLLGPSASEGVALRTLKEFRNAGVLSPEEILRTGWHGLVRMLDRGGFVRRQAEIASDLLQIVGTLKERYLGDLNRLHFFAEDENDLEEKIRGLGRGVKPLTVGVFLRELRDIWEKAEPPLAQNALLAIRRLKLVETTDATAVLYELRATCDRGELGEVRFSDLEAALARLGQAYCSEGKCSGCPVRQECKSVQVES